MAENKQTSKKTITIIVVLIFAVLAVFPITASGNNVSANYTPTGCNRSATVVAVFRGDVPVYADANLTNLILTIRGNSSGKLLQKYLVCSTNIEEDILQIQIANSIVFVKNPNAFLPRAAADPK